MTAPIVRSKSPIAASAIRPTSKTTEGTIFVKPPGIKSGLEGSTGSQVELTPATWLSVAEMLGRSKKTPAPMLPRSSKTVAPSKSCGLKPVCKVKSIDSSSAWNGNAVILASGLQKCKLARR